MASDGDCVLRSATRIPPLHRSGLERQGHNGIRQPPDRYQTQRSERSPTSPRRQRLLEASDFAAARIRPKRRSRLRRTRSSDTVVGHGRRTRSSDTVVGHGRRTRSSDKPAFLSAIILWVADYENARHSTSSESPVCQTSTPRLNRNEPPAARPLSYPALYAAHLQ
jgi:hypothetical protein